MKLLKNKHNCCIIISVRLIKLWKLYSKINLTIHLIQFIYISNNKKET